MLITSLIEEIRPKIGDDDPEDVIYLDKTLKIYIKNAVNTLNLEGYGYALDSPDIEEMTEVKLSNGSELTVDLAELLKLQTAIEVTKSEKAKADRDATSYRTEAMTFSRTDRPRYIQETLERLMAEKQSLLLGKGYLF